LWYGNSPSWIFDPDTLAFLDANQAAILEYGYSWREFLAMKVLDLSPSEDIVMHLRYLLHPAWKGNGANQLWRHQKKDGKIIEVHVARHRLNVCGRTAELLVTTPQSSEPY
jgi:hypothetical protein